MRGEAVEFFRLRHVGAHGKRLGAARLDGLFRNAESVCIEIRQHDLHAFGAQAPRKGKPYSAGRARYNGGFSLEVSHSWHRRSIDLSRRSVEEGHVVFQEAE